MDTLGFVAAEWCCAGMDLPAPQVKILPDSGTIFEKGLAGGLW
jgi:hypothetical protein